jgi:hypothetical protein
MKNMTTATILGLFALALMVPTFSNADSGAGTPGTHGDWKAKLQACVTTNGGGTLPDLTPTQWKAKKSCFKNNKGDKTAIQACEDQAGLPEVDAATQAALKKCHAGHHHHHHHDKDAAPATT